MILRERILRALLRRGEPTSSEMIGLQLAESSIEGTIKPLLTALEKTGMVTHVPIAGSSIGGWSLTRQGRQHLLDLDEERAATISGKWRRRTREKRYPKASILNERLARLFPPPPPPALAAVQALRRAMDREPVRYGVLENGDVVIVQGATVLIVVPAKEIDALRAQAREIQLPPRPPRMEAA